MRVLHGMVIEAKKEEVLKALRENRETHQKIVSEAKEGYRQKAVTLLEEALVATRKDDIDPMRGWSATLPPVKDHTKVYDRAIKMFELETREVVELTQEQVGYLIMDDWDWKQDFIASNAFYSATAAEMV